LSLLFLFLFDWQILNGLESVFTKEGVAPDIFGFVYDCFFYSPSYYLEMAPQALCAKKD
jgi:hypothetical protein